MRVAWVRSAIRVLLLTLTLGAVQHYRNDLHPDNEASRIYAALAIVDHGTVTLDPLFDDFFPGWRNWGRPPNGDVSVFDGVYRLDKAPGVTLLAVPVVALIRLAGHEPSLATLAWMLSLLLSTLPTALFAEALRRRLLADRTAASGIATALVLTTPWMTYGGMLFGHALSAAFVGGGILLALGTLHGTTAGAGRAAGSSSAGERLRAVAAGLLLGLGVLTEYTDILLALVLAAAIAIDPTRRRRLPWLMLGSLPAIIGLLAWNQANFGSPFALSYGYKYYPDLASICSQGAFGMTYPSPERLFGILLGPTRGLLFVSPWLLAGGVGAVFALRDRELAPAWRVALGAGIPAWCLWIASFVDWTAGACFGPRHLLAGLPLFAIGTAVFMSSPVGTNRFVRPALWGLMASSFLLIAATTWTFPYPDPAVANPVAEVSIPVLLRAGSAPSILDSWIPWPAGSLISIACALALAGLGMWAERAIFRDAWFWVVAVAAAVLHLTLVTLPETPPEKVVALRDTRAMAFELMGRPDMAAEVRRGRP